MNAKEALELTKSVWAENVTEEQVDELSMCGVFFSNEFNCLVMFV
jgi:hypothetical protein